MPSHAGVQPLPALTAERQKFHADLITRKVLAFSDGVATNADKSQASSTAFAGDIAHQIGGVLAGSRLPGQKAGDEFEHACAAFLESSFALFDRLRPGSWTVLRVPNRQGIEYIARFEQYAHLRQLSNEIEKNPALRSVLGNAYDIAPDIVVSRAPVTDADINAARLLVDEDVARRAPLRSVNQPRDLLHAVISCKWTFRSDRAQNARSESLNLIRNRKGRLPHIVVVTAEPSPSRLASLALGTGDIDCLYHFALPELVAAVGRSGNDEAQSLVDIMVQGNRLKDIADLPLDLAI